MKQVTVLAPAKLNLTLDITGLLPNGYHTMDMLMQTVNMVERVRLTAARDIRITSSGAKLPLGKTNTAFKAAVAFFTEIGLLAGV
ncbi:MAG: 4-(cytidine 5'-diphospho)-2-C-methyl-D-erythritol kinase, partial [Pygmaiobacter sp.]